MTDDCLVFKFLWCGVNRKQVIRYQRKKNAVFNFLQCSVNRALNGDVTGLYSPFCLFNCGYCENYVQRT